MDSVQVGSGWSLGMTRSRQTHSTGAPRFVAPRWLPWALGFSAFVLLGSVAIYGVSVYLESRVLTLGETTCVIKEENQDLQLHLNRLKSYHNVAVVSEKLQGLSIAQDVVTLPQAKPQPVAVIAPPPNRPVPTTIYGY